MMSDCLMVFFNNISPSTCLSLYSSASLTLTLLLNPQVCVTIALKKQTVTAKFRYKAKDVGQPPRQRGMAGGGKRRLDKGQCLMHAKCAPRTHFFMAAQLRGAAAERTKTMLPRGGGREGGKWGKCLRY